MSTVAAMSSDSASHRMPPSLRLTVTALIERDGDSWHGFCPAFKGLHVDGCNENDVLKNLLDAANVYIQSLAMHGDELPIHSYCDFREEQISAVPPGALLRQIELQWPSPDRSGIK